MNEPLALENATNPVLAQMLAGRLLASADETIPQSQPQNKRLLAALFAWIIIGGWDKMQKLNIVIAGAREDGLPFDEAESRAILRSYIRWTENIQRKSDHPMEVAWLDSCYTTFSEVAWWLAPQCKITATIGQQGPVLSISSLMDTGLIHLAHLTIAELEKIGALGGAVSLADAAIVRAFEHRGLPVLCDQPKAWEALREQASKGLITASTSTT